MTLEIAIIMFVILGSIVFFSFEILPMEVTALGALGFLLLTNVITPAEAIAGFSNPAVITIGAMFIISRSLENTGFLEVLADQLYNLAKHRAWTTFGIFFFTVSIISGFINNTAAVAIFIPLAINLCKKFHISPTRILLPLSFAAIFGGTLTLIGTSTNLVVNGYMLDHDIAPFKIFEFTKLGIVFLLVGTVYNMIIARYVLHSRSILSSLTSKYRVGKYLTEYMVKSKSNIIGKTMPQTGLAKKYDMELLCIIRDDERYNTNLRAMVFEEGDMLICRVAVEEIIPLRDECKLQILTDIKLNQRELSGGHNQLVEALVTLDSALVGKTLAEFDFRRHYNAFVLAIRRHKENIYSKVAHVRLHFSDTLLILSPKENLDRLRNSRNIVVLEELRIALRYQRLWYLSVLVIPVVMLIASTGMMDIMKAAILGAILLLVLQSISIHDAYEAINWPVIFLIAAMVPMGTAIQNSGMAELISQLIVSAGDMLSNLQSPVIYMSLMYLVTFTLSAFVSNTAIAVVMSPIAIALSNQIGVDARPLLVAVAFGASSSFMTPVGYQTNMMVFGPGQYRNRDFMLTGLPLTLIFWGLATWLIPKYWSF